MPSPAGVTLPYTFREWTGMTVKVTAVRETAAELPDHWLTFDLEVTNTTSDTHVILWKNYITATNANGEAIEGVGTPPADNPSGRVDRSRTQRWTIAFKASNLAYPVTFRFADGAIFVFPS